MLAVALTSTLAASCASAKRQMEQTWNPRLGVYTYAAAVSSMGPPAAKEQLGDGVVATWTFQQQTMAESYVLTGLPAYRTLTDRLTLTFDANNVLRQWSWQRQ